MNNENPRLYLDWGAVCGAAVVPGVAGATTARCSRSGIYPVRPPETVTPAGSTPTAAGSTLPTSPHRRRRQCPDAFWTALHSRVTPSMAWLWRAQQPRTGTPAAAAQRLRCPPCLSSGDTAPAARHWRRRASQGTGRFPEDWSRLAHDTAPHAGGACHACAAHRTRTIVRLCVPCVRKRWALRRCAGAGFRRVQRARAAVAGVRVPCRAAPVCPDRLRPPSVCLARDRRHRPISRPPRQAPEGSCTFLFLASQRVLLHEESPFVGARGGAAAVRRRVVAAVLVSRRRSFRSARWAASAGGAGREDRQHAWLRPRAVSARPGPHSAPARTRPEPGLTRPVPPGLDTPELVTTLVSARKSVVAVHACAAQPAASAPTKAAAKKRRGVCSQHSASPCSS